MKIATFDAGFHWDDPNLCWGDPSYLLEPGDPGYAPPPDSVSEPNKRKKKLVKRNAYYPSRQADQVAWLINFKIKLPGHAAALGLSNDVVDATVAG